MEGNPVSMLDFSTDQNQFLFSHPVCNMQTYRKLDLVPAISLNPGRNFRDRLHYTNKRVDILKTPAYEKQGRLNTDHPVMSKYLAEGEKLNEKEPDVFLST